MEFRYDDMQTFMERYFRDFSAYGQDSKTQDRVRQFFAPELEFIPFMHGHQPLIGPEQFLKAQTHPAIQETLTPKQLVIDDKKGIVSAMAKVELKHKATGEVRLSAFFNTLYHLKLDENNSLKITKIELFFEHTPETARLLEIFMSQ